MELVVDANILVAGFLRAAVTREMLLDERLTLAAPEYAILETQRILLTPRIQRKIGKLSVEELKLALAVTANNVQIFPETAYRPKLTDARKFAPDPADTPYLALALHLDIPLWSNDALLKEQDRVVVYTTQEVLDRI
ncbi:MAG: hypothetical protein HYZ94_00465 [Candidatus Omnitrophica bacterium]|nr:hypothetical protein [Candidatus Omnitrophota bacterium]